ncbi:MAG TPA: pyridoxal-phosphate dependent enzyme, partial [Thermomicrobiales bacterium]|nr:pyridoxal-phosphate dependent enzyme [Thermomicrobiales bacterium]
MRLATQPRMRLAALPTPLQYAANLTGELGGPRVYLKRDDLTGLALGGNKTRKLEYLIADAALAGATHVITVGAAQSNHARQTAAAARLAGMEAVLVLNSASSTPEEQGNLLLDRILGATVHVVSSHAQRAARVEEIAADLSDSGAIP